MDEDALTALVESSDLDGLVRFIDGLASARDWDGIELTRMIRNPDSFEDPRLPIVALTAYTEMKYVIAAMDAGITEFLCKPVSAIDLYRRIQNIIENPKPFIRTKTYFGPDRRQLDDPDYSGDERRQIPSDSNMVDSMANAPNV